MKKQKEKLPSEMGGHREELVDHYWGSINHIASLIKASELKAGLILSFYGILLNLLFQNVTDLFNFDGSHWIFYGLLIALGLCIIVSIYFAIRCFIPRMETSYETNAFFFKDIITKYGDIKAFSNHFYSISLNEKELFSQLGQQIYILSKISAHKFRNVNLSVKLLGTSLVILVFVAAYYIIQIIG